MFFEYLFRTKNFFAHIIYYLGCYGVYVLEFAKLIGADDHDGFKNLCNANDEFYWYLG